MQSVAKKSEKSLFKAYLSLTKAPLSAAVGLPGLLVYLLVKQHFSVELWIALLGIFLLALGVSALNQYQERYVDAQMPRTQNRPLVTGSISEMEALCLIVALIGFATICFYAVLGWIGVGISALVILLYNVIYTPLKKISPYAVIPGAILGVIPPVICWMVAGESIVSPAFISLAWFYFIWQIPHFWLLVLIYHRDYAKAGLPTMVDVFGEVTLARITFIWILLTIISALMVVPFFMPKSYVILGLILGHSLFLLWKSLILLKPFVWIERLTCKKTFMQLNLYTLAIVLFLVIDRW